MHITLTKSTRKDKKFMVKLSDGKIIHFGAAGMSDYTLHKDLKRKQAYILRHKANEDWNKSGLETAGFWSRWILWNKPSLTESIKDAENRFGIKIKYIS